MRNIVREISFKVCLIKGRAG